MASPPKSPVEKIDELQPPEEAQIPFSLVEKHENKVTKLFANSGNVKPIEGQNKWYHYRFKDDVFVYRVVVLETNYPEYKDFEIEVTLSGNEKVIRSARPKSGRVFVEINDFVRQISFRPPQNYFPGGKTIDGIEVYGFSRSDVGSFVQFARDLDQLKGQALSEIENRETVHQKVIEQAATEAITLAEIRKEVSALKSQSDRQKTTIRSLESERSDLTANIEGSKAALDLGRRELESLRRQLETKSNDRSTINDEISTLSKKLAGLRANIDLFPSELDSFVKQGARNNRTLFWLAAAPIAIIVIMFGLLVFGAADLSTKITDSQKINIAALVVSRAPYLAISLAVIAASYQIAKYFISELVQVNRQRLALTKVSIIAKDVSTSAEIGLGLSDIERYNLRVRLKMELLKDHLKSYLSSSPVVSLPDQITSAISLDLLSGEIRGKGAEKAAQLADALDASGAMIPKP